MLLFALIALIILTFVLLLHYTHHFQFYVKKCCQRRSISNSVSNPNTNIQTELMKSTNHTTCCCKLLPIDGELEFDFFPMSFLLYVSFLIILCTLTIIVQVLNYYHYKPNATIIDLLFGYSLKYKQHSLLEMHQIKMDQINVVYIMDYILTYGILILSVCVSLFSYYRYYTTLMSTKKLKTVSTRKLFSKFRIFAVIFSGLFILQIHMWYWLFPIIIILFCLFNFYCTFKFAAMLIQQYKLFIDLKCIAMDADAQDMLRSSIFAKYISLICCVLQSINLSLFLIMYNVNIIYYLPILWAVSCFIFSLNFVRNRQFFKRHINCICFTQNQRILNENILVSKPENNLEILTKNEFIEIDLEPEGNKPLHPNTNKIFQATKSSQSLCDLYTQKPIMPSVINRTLSEPAHHAKLDLNSISTESYDSYDSMNLPKLHETIDSKSLNIYNDPKPPQLSFLQPAHSDPIASTNHNKVHENTRNNMTALRALSGLSIISPRMYHTHDDQDNNSTPEPLPETPVPLHLIVTPLVENEDVKIEDTIKVNALDSIRDINGEEDMDAGFQILFEDEDLDGKDNGSNVDFGVNELQFVNHGRSNSLPMNVNVDELFESFNILAKCGFYSLKNVNEMNKYQKRFSMVTKSATMQ